MAADAEIKKAAGSERFKALWPEIRELIRPRRKLLAIGFVLMLINRVSGLVLPASTKFLIDDIIGKQRRELLLPLVLAVLAATAIQGVTSFTLTQLLSKAAQRLIAELRRKVQAHVGRLPVAYYDSNKSGALVSRIMSDVEGVRNLIGTGLVEFVGGVLTAVFALVILIRISALMTGLAISFVLVFGIVLGKAFKTIRPIFRARGKINAEVTGRLTESLGGVRVIKGYHAEEREEKVFARGVQRLLDNVLQSLTAMSLHEPFGDAAAGRGGVGGDVRGRAADFRRHAHAGRVRHVHGVSGVPGRARFSGCGNRHAALRSAGGPGAHARSDARASRG